MFLFFKASFPSLESTLPPIQRIPGMSTHTPSGAEAKNECIYTSTTPIVLCFHGMFGAALPSYSLTFGHRASSV